LDSAVTVKSAKLTPAACAPNTTIAPQNNALARIARSRTLGARNVIMTPQPTNAIIDPISIMCNRMFRNTAITPP
jgi:hypothetical protein